MGGPKKYKIRGRSGKILGARGREERLGREVWSGGVFLGEKNGGQMRGMVGFSRWKEWWRERNKMILGVESLRILPK